MPRQRLIAAFTDFWFRPVTAYPLAYMRIGFAITASAIWILLWKDKESLLMDGGFFAPEAINLSPRVVSLFEVFKSDAFAIGFLVFGLVCIVLMGVGLLTRIACVGYFIFASSYIPKISMAISGWDYLGCIVAFLLMLSPSNAVLSLDRRWFAKHASDYIPIYPMRIIQWQFMVLFVTTAWLKTLEPAWRSGIEAGHFLLGGYSNIHTALLLKAPLLNTIITHLTLVIELTVSFLLWHRRTRALGYFLLAGLMGVVATSPVFLYPMTIAAMSFCFLEERDLHALRGFVGKPWSEQWRGGVLALWDGVCATFGASERRA